MRAHIAVLTPRRAAFMTLCYDAGPAAPGIITLRIDVKPRISQLVNSISVMRFAYYGNTMAISFYYLLLKLVIEFSLPVIYGGCFCCLFFNRADVSLIIDDNQPAFLENKSGIC
ncbi:hypothetical protein ACQFN5_19275 [Klebsiella sp. WOUb02]|uniref:hypothetical protein n=1 Tax=Klebsiella sp. WOUb02 TaxID=3161071 RepID=UPI003CE9ADF5